MNMLRSFSKSALALAAAATLVACSTLKADNPALMSARASFASAQNNPQTNALAAAELTSAGVALNQANEAFRRGDSVAEVDHLAYLASQKVAVAQQTARQKQGEAAVASAEAERDRTRLAARTSEADAAQRQAMNAQQDAQAAQRSAEASRRNADASLRTAQSAQMQNADAQARAAALEEQLRALNAKKTERGMVVTVSDVLFDTGRAELKAGSARNLEKLVAFFNAYPQRTAIVEGFTDSVGSDSSNQDLSTRRAAAVRNTLLEMGVARERISARGYGEAFPVAGNDSNSGRQLNRRVEVVLSDENGQVVPR